jgi:hypothetical protein
MLKHNILINKGFSLNEYDGHGKYYELVETDESLVEKILNVAGIGYDPEDVDEKVILQCKEDFSNKLIYVDGNVWGLSDDEFDKIIETIPDKPTCFDLININQSLQKENERLKYVLEAACKLLGLYCECPIEYIEDAVDIIECDKNCNTFIKSSDCYAIYFSKKFGLKDV